MKTNNKRLNLLPFTGIVLLGFLAILISCQHDEKNEISSEQKRNAAHRESLSGNKPPFKASIDPGEKTQVLILGTPHLRELDENFKHSSLSPLLEVLERFSPDLIGVESIRPDRLEDMENRERDFAQVIAHFALRRIQLGHNAQETLKVSRQEATHRAGKLMDTVRKEPDNRIARIKLVKHLLASYDDISSVLHWSFLPREFRENTNLMTPAIRSYLNEKMTAADEKFSIGAILAKRLTLSRIYHIDDHHEKDMYMKIAAELSSQVKDNPALKEISAHPFYAKSSEALKEAHQNDNLLPYYTHINSPEYGQKDMVLQWDVWFRTHLKSGLDRTRMALWEVRNLNIASHIRRASASHPGKRFLAIIGVGHKPFLDAYLSQMADIRVVQLQDLL